MTGCKKDAKTIFSLQKKKRKKWVLSQICKAICSATLIKQFLGESSGTSFLNYWIEAALKRVKPDLQCIMYRETHALFRDTAKAILHVLDTNPDTQWNTMNTKAFYKCLPK